MTKFLTGTSGWMYKPWNKKFFPKDLKEKDYLTYYSKHFQTVEINATFYRMPSATTFTNWYMKTGKKFIFSVKLNQFITHRKRLILDDESKDYLKAFLDNCQELKEKFGALLIQLPPSMKSNLERLETFLQYLIKTLARKKYKPDLAVEFRHPSWINEATYALLKKYNVAFVIAHSYHYPCERVFTTTFSYIRLHGPNKMFASLYTEKELDEWAAFMKKAKPIKKFYTYFNNDYEAYAIDNATYLAKIV